MAARKLPLLAKILLLIFCLSLIVGIVGLLKQIDEKMSTTVPDKGGVLTEGILGTPRFVNPILTISDADRDLTALIYSGLMRLEKNTLIPDLAEKYEISEDGLCYIFTLKENIMWSDGEPITSNDIIFTLNLVKNPITKSPKRPNWEGVSLEKIDDRIIKFCMAKPYAPFLENTTIGILPSHIWEEITAEQIPLSDFNIKATGSGPYKIDKITRNSSGIITSYSLVPNKYFAMEQPYIQKIMLKFYPSGQKLTAAYINGEIDSASAVSPNEILEIKKNTSQIITHQLPRIFAVFFNQNEQNIFTNPEIRKALNLATDKNRITEEILKGFGVPLEHPIPPKSVGAIYPETNQPSYDEQLEQAKNLLTKNGWKMDEEENILIKTVKKEKIKFEFSLSTSNVSDLAQTAWLLKEMWEKLGAKVNVKIFEIGDLEQNVIRPRKYDALLFGEIMGREPDPFAFWHSSQRNDPGLNISMYTNITVDKLLEDARTIMNTEKREEKYETFQIELQKDAPAVFLYSPYFIYVLPYNIKGVEENSITIPSERFSNIYRWYINTKKVWNLWD